MTGFEKRATSMGSALVDPVVQQATTAPVPKPAIANKTAPGRTGPGSRSMGLSPRTSYSPALTGTPPTPDAGAQSQKSVAPPKVAHLEIPNMTMSEMSRPSLNDLIKVAMETSAARIDLSLETARQLGNAGEPPTPEEEKTAAAEDDIPPEYIDKLAAGCLFLAKEMDPKVASVNFPGTENDLGPGKGPNSSDVTAAMPDGENPIEAGQMGKAIPQDVPPLKPPMQKDPTREAGPDNQMQTNDSMEHPEQPVEPIVNQKASLSNESVKASAAYVNNLIAVGLAKVAADETGEVGLFSTRTGEKLAFTVGDPGKTPPTAPKRVAPKYNPKQPGQMRPKDPGQPSSKEKTGEGEKNLGLGGTQKGMKTRQEGLQRKLPERKPNAPQMRLKPGVAGQPNRPKYSEAEVENLRALGLLKEGEDAINPAKISGGKSSDNGVNPPDGAAPSEEGIPPEPSDVTGQKNKMLATNQAAIDYTKKDAKGDPIKDVNQVLSEPAMSAAHDTTLNKALDHTQEAGAKISSAMGAAIRKIASGKARKAASGVSPEAAAMSKIALLGALPGASEAPVGQKLPGAISGTAGSVGGALAGGLGGAGVGAGLGGLAGAGLGALGGLAFGGDPSEGAALGGKLGLGAGALGGAGLGGYYGAGKGYEAAMRPFGEIEALRGQNIAMKDWIEGANQAGMGKAGSVNFGDLSGRTLAHAMAKVGAGAAGKVVGAVQDVAQAGRKAAPKAPRPGMPGAPRAPSVGAPPGGGMKPPDVSDFAPPPVAPGGTPLDEAAAGMNLSPKQLQDLMADNPDMARKMGLLEEGIGQQKGQFARGQLSDAASKRQAEIDELMQSLMGQGMPQAQAAEMAAKQVGMGTGTAMALGGGLGLAGVGGAGLAAGAMDEGEYPISPGYTAPYVGAVEKKYPVPGKYASADPVKLAAARAVVSKLAGKKEKRSMMPGGSGSSGTAGSGEQAQNTEAANQPAASPPGM